MRAFGAIGAAFFMAWVLPASGQAAASPTDAAHLEAASCGAPGPEMRPHRHVRHVWHHRHHRRHWWHARLPMMPPPPPIAAYYNTMIPSPYDPAYDRAMVLHFRSPPVSGEYPLDPGYPPTPPIYGVHPYRLSAYGGVYQYDGLTGQYIRLSAYDAAHALPPPSPSPTPAPAPAR